MSVQTENLNLTPRLSISSKYLPLFHSGMQKTQYYRSLRGQDAQRTGFLPLGIIKNSLQNLIYTIERAFISSSQRAWRGAGLATALALLLTKRPDLTETTAATRVLQLLMEHQQQSKSFANPLSLALSKTGLVEILVESMRAPLSLYKGESSVFANQTTKAILLEECPWYNLWITHFLLSRAAQDKQEASNVCVDPS